MINILLVEDEAEKRRMIVAAIVRTGLIDQDRIEMVSDVVSAKRSLERKKFDLLILDINVPPRADKVAEADAGLDILNFIKANRKAIPPSYIVGITAYEDSARLAATAFSSPLWKLLPFSYEDDAWQDALGSAVAYLSEKAKPPYATDGRTYHTDLAILVALPEELAGLLSLGANWEEERVPHDHSRYWRGTFEHQGNALSVVAVAAPRMGMPAAAATASKLIHTFRPRYLAMTGICAGVRGKAELGDLLVADPCFDWGSGKWKHDASAQEPRFQPAAYPWRLDERLRAAIREVGDDPTVMEAVLAAFQGTKPAKPSVVHVDAMASGGSVLQATKLMSDVREQHKNLVGIEMESYAVFTAAEYASDPRPQCLSIKAVCDFGDEEKADDMHAYAAHASAHFLYWLAVRHLCD